MKGAEKYFDFIAALLICANPIAWLLPVASPLPIVCISILLLYAYGCVKYRTNILSLPTSILLIIGLVIFSINILVDSNNIFLQNYFLGFLSLAIIGFQLGWIRHNFERVLQYVAVLGIFLIPFIATMDMGGGDSGMKIDYGHWMGVSYGLLRLLCALIILLLMYKSTKTVKLVYLGAITFYIVFFLNYASRGAILAVMFLLAVLLFIRANGSSVKFYVVSGILTVVTAGIVANFEKVLIWSAGLLQSWGLTPFFLLKMISMINHGNSLNSGRDDISRAAWEGISESPIIGNGIGSFEVPNHGYTHNVFTQVFFETGIVPYTILCILSLGALWILFSKKITREIKIFEAYLMASGFIELLFSSTLWRSQIFWMFIGNTLFILLNRRKLYG